MLREPRTLTIIQAADELGEMEGQVSLLAWLRFDERLGALPLARRTPAGWRYYTSEGIQWLRRLGGERKRRLTESNG